MAFDAARGRVTLVGGYSNDGFTDMFDLDTWVWTGTNWKNLAVGSPGRRAFAALADLPGRRALMLYGGSRGSSADGYPFVRDTWLPGAEQS